VGNVTIEVGSEFQTMTTRLAKKIAFLVVLKKLTDVFGCSHNT